MAQTPNDPPHDRLKALEDRIAKARKSEDETPHAKKDYAQANLAWRMVTELVAGLVIGFAIGYGLDTLLGTGPIFLVVFIFLGLAAGVKVMIATSKELNGTDAGQPASDDEKS